MSDVDVLDLGPCCACGCSGARVRNVILLTKLAPISGRGWGCIVCGLPPNGAVAVVCDACLEANAPLRFACRGRPGSDGRVPIEELAGDFDHYPIPHG